MARSGKRVRDIDAKPSSTKRLVRWIRTIRRKQRKCRRNRRRDLRIETVLRCTLVKAEHELRAKQTPR
jgi:hypothetical protein